MDDLLLCTICLENYNSSQKIPLSLICGHTFCKECLLQIGKNGLGVMCPLDKRKDLRSINAIPKNFSLLDIIDMMQKQAKAKCSITNLIDDKLQIIETCKDYLTEVSKMEAISKEEENRSLQKLSKGFEVIREALNYRESELMQNIKRTHESISERISLIYSSVGVIIEEHTKEVEQLTLLKSSSGESSLVDSSKYASRSPSVAEFEELKSIVEKLPIQILLLPEQFENCLTRFAKIIDDTQSRTNDLKAVFVADVRVQDGDRFMPSSTFVKTWRILNDGTQEWPNGCWCVFSHGTFKGENVVIDPAWPGEEVDVSVVLSAPAEIGRHFSYWKLVDPNGLTFGPQVWAEIEVYSLD